MSVAYKDYYKVLGVEKKAGKAEISKAFKKLARKHHPDLNQGNKEAEKKFKELNEAYEVLKDPEKRRMYDQLGPNWQHGQNFQPPPGFENFSFGGTGDAQGFSDFFETIFGGAGRGGMGDSPFSQSGFGGFQQGPTPGQDVEVAIELTLEEAYAGGPRQVSFQSHPPAAASSGNPLSGIRTLEITVPAGVREGARIRLAGQGRPGRHGGPAGNLYFKVRLAPHQHFSLEKNNIICELPLAPWDAVLGTTVHVPTLEKPVELTIPPGISSGQKLRLRGKGLGTGEKKGDQFVRIIIKTPTELSDKEKELWKQLASLSSFSPGD